METLAGVLSLAVSSGEEIRVNTTTILMTSSLF